MCWSSAFRLQMAGALVGGSEVLSKLKLALVDAELKLELQQLTPLALVARVSRACRSKTNCRKAIALPRDDRRTKAADCRRADIPRAPFRRSSTQSPASACERANAIASARSAMTRAPLGHLNPRTISRRIWAASSRRGLSSVTIGKIGGRLDHASHQRPLLGVPFTAGAEHANQAARRSLRGASRGSPLERQACERNRQTRRTIARNRSAPSGRALARLARSRGRCRPDQCHRRGRRRCHQAIRHVMIADHPRPHRRPSRCRPRARNVCSLGNRSITWAVTSAGDSDADREGRPVRNFR